MEIFRNFDLEDFNSFKIKVKANFFVKVFSLDDIFNLIDLPEFKNNQKLFLGGGTNILFTKDFDGIIVLNKIKGINILKEDDENVWIQAFGGENWHDFVLFTVNKNYWGLENLSFIPGTVAGAPVQNIGAYGAELKDVLEYVEVVDIETKEKKTFSNQECSFGYRDSIFKHSNNKYFILAIVVRLSKIKNVNVKYKPLFDHFEKDNLAINYPKEISDVVIDIRKDKLPDPVFIPNAGSFFKNIYVDKTKLDSLIVNYPDIPFFKEGEKYKIPTGWLLEKTDLKGKRIGNVGLYEKQALVIVNHDGATGQEIKDFALYLINEVKNKFDIEIIPEVNIF